MWFIRRIMRISWTEKRANELVLKEANLERSLIKTIRQRQLQFLGHICRHKGLEPLAITGTIEGHGSRGRQRVTFIESLKSWAIGKGSNNEFTRLSENKYEWRRNMIVNVCSRQAPSVQFALNTNMDQDVTRCAVNIVREKLGIAASEMDPAH
ncbi:eukaryotic translation initiation factor 3 subunit f [Plakobranchus ocellatus]|uniref:Eukaryotic translation initiation factor 3 subunit f n=1 Tax=Plakobranchus ocellatus TaxID=259542 RepID=A0AAV3ZMC6_9GAST|nr:eukaryotic translation initiation factor 3 subunit f [Plakobranchus ocellatus]